MSGYHERLEGVLRHDRRRLAALLDMVRYPNHAGIQAEGILLTQTFSERIDNLVAFILQLNQPGAPLTFQEKALIPCSDLICFLPCHETVRACIDEVLAASLVS